MPREARWRARRAVEALLPKRPVRVRMAWFDDPQTLGLLAACGAAGGLAYGLGLREVSRWFGDVVSAVDTTARSLRVALVNWWKTYAPERGTFTEQFEYPELPAPVAPRYRGYHRFDLTTCIACDQCARACPVDCIYIGKERVENGKGFKVTGFTIDYTKCMFCALCVEPCPVDCIFMGSTLDLSSYGRDGSIVDFARLPVDIAWGRATLNPSAVAESKVILEPVHGGPNQPAAKPNAPAAGEGSQPTAKPGGGEETKSAD